MSKNITSLAVQLAESLIAGLNTPWDGGFLHYSLSYAPPDWPPFDSPEFWLKWFHQVILEPRVAYRNFTDLYNISSPTALNISYRNLFGWGLTWILFLPILCLFVFLPLAVYKHHRHRQKKRGSSVGPGCCALPSSTKPTRAVRYVVDSFKLAVLNKPISTPSKSLNKPTDPPRKRKPRRYCVLFLVVITTLILLASLVWLALAFSVSEDFFSATSSRKRPSLRTGVQQAFGHVIDFLEQGVVEGNATTQAILHTLNIKLKILVGEAIEDLAKRLLVVYGITPMFEASRNLSSVLFKTNEALEWIHENEATLFQKLNEFKGTIVTLREGLTDKLSLVCPQLSGSVRVECDMLKGQLSDLRVSIDQSNINIESSRNIKFVSHKFGVDISVLAKGLLDNERKIQGVLDPIYKVVQDKFNFAGLFDQVSGIWSTAETALVNLTEDLAKTQKAVNGALDKTSTISGAILAIVAFLMLACALAGVLLLAIACEYLQRPAGKCFPRRRAKPNPVKIVQKNASATTALYRLLGLKTKPLQAWILICGILMTGPAVVALTCLITPGLMETEMCRYLTTPMGVRMSDESIDAFIAGNWYNWTHDLGLDNWTVPVNLPTPHRVLMGLTETCSFKNVGLLTAMNLQGLINVTAVVNGPMFISVLTVGEQYARESLVQLDLTSVIPTDSKALFEEAISVTNYFDNVDYEPSLREVQKPLILLNLNEYSSKLEVLVRSARIWLPGKDEVIVLAEFARRLKELKQDAIVHSLAQLKEQFTILQENAYITKTITSFIDRIVIVDKITKDKQAMAAKVGPTYQVVVTQLVPKVSRLLSALLHRLELSLARCQPLYAAFTAGVNGVCAPGQFSQQMAGMGLTFVVAVACFQLLVLCMWALVRMIQVAQFEMTESDC